MAEPSADPWPVPLSVFVGRGEELTALGALVDAHRLVTVLGAPGIGKTRLVLEWVRRARGAEARSEGVRFCDLSDASSAEEVVRFVAKTLRVSLVAEGDMNVAQLGAALAGLQRTLLVLDNFEHLVEEAHPLVIALLEAAPRAHLLVTSRERIKLVGEVVFELGPLASSTERDDAVRLFVERAREVHSSYALAPGEDLTVRELVSELDGNPLAIELAAARTRVLSAKEILARMPARFEVLVSERRGQPRRSALLEAIEASWCMLPPWGKTALAECSVFRGGFDLRSAEEILDLRSLDDAPRVVDVLESLCDKSLIAVRRAPRASGLRFVLHASIRAFATQRLAEAGTTSHVHARHAKSYATACKVWGQALLGPGAPRALDELRVEAENLTFALRHLVASEPGPDEANRALFIAVTLAGVLGADGPFALRASALQDAITFADRTTPDPSLLVEALDASVLALVAVGRPGESRANAERACALAETLSDALHARTLSTLGLSLAMAGEVEAAAQSLHQAIALLRAAGERLYEGRVLGRLAWLEWVTGDLEAARDHFRQALEHHRAVGDRSFEAMNSGYLAVVAHELGELETPGKLLEHAIAEQQQLGHRRVEADLTSALGSLFHERGALADARVMHGRALQIYRQVGHSRDEASLLNDIAKVALDDGSLDEARAAYAEALPLASATANAFTLAEAEAGLGVLAALEGNLDDARAHFARARVTAPPGPRGIELVDLVRGQLDVAEARAAYDDHDPLAMNEHLAAARARLAVATASASQARGGVLRFRERRLAVASLARALEEAAAWGAPSLRPEAGPQLERAERAERAKRVERVDAETCLTVFVARRALKSPEGKVMELERHPALWKLVECFVEAHARAPGSAIAVERLVEAGWPDERVRADAGARRVYTALSTLRRRGLRAWIMKKEAGYCVTPDLRVVVAK